MRIGQNKTNFLFKPCEKERKYKPDWDNCKKAVLYLNLRDDGCKKKQALIYSKRNFCRYDSTRHNDGPSSHRILKPQINYDYSFKGWDISGTVNYKMDRKFTHSLESVLLTDNLDTDIDEQILRKELADPQSITSKFRQLEDYNQNLEKKIKNPRNLEKEEVIQWAKNLNDDVKDEIKRKEHKYLIYGNECEAYKMMELAQEVKDDQVEKSNNFSESLKKQLRHQQSIKLTNTKIQQNSNQEESQYSIPQDYPTTQKSIMDSQELQTNLLTQSQDSVAEVLHIKKYKSHQIYNNLKIDELKKTNSLIEQLHGFPDPVMEKATSMCVVEENEEIEKKTDKQNSQQNQITLSQSNCNNTKESTAYNLQSVEYLNSNQDLVTTNYTLQSTQKENSSQKQLSLISKYEDGSKNKAHFNSNFINIQTNFSARNTNTDLKTPIRKNQVLEKTRSLRNTRYSQKFMETPKKKQYEVFYLNPKNKKLKQLSKQENIKIMRSGCMLDPQSQTGDKEYDEFNQNLNTWVDSHQQSQYSTLLQKSQMRDIETPSEATIKNFYQDENEKTLEKIMKKPRKLEKREILDKRKNLMKQFTKSVCKIKKEVHSPALRDRISQFLNTTNVSHRSLKIGSNSQKQESVYSSRLDVKN